MTAPAAIPTSRSPVTLREVTRENLQDVLHLSVSPDQQVFVATNAVSIAQAHFHPESAWFRAIYADDVAVGFVMLEIDPARSEHHIWRMMIDRRYQRHGFGARAVERLIEFVRSRPGAADVSVSCVPGEGSPLGFYEKLGFVRSGEVIEGEIVLRRRL